MTRSAPFLLAISLAAAMTRAANVESVASSLHPVRVLVVDKLPQVILRSEVTLRAQDARDPALTIQFPANENVVVRTAGGRLLLNDQALPSTDVYIESGGAPLVLAVGQGDAAAESTLLGRIRVLAGDTLQVINEVEIEDYVASVVASEIWPNFEEEAFRAQAIVTRTYVLYHMLRRLDAIYDVAATQGSQVYRGIRADAVGRRATEAAQYTRGLVCTWRDQDEDRLFCTYYSAACGGMSQSAAPLGAESDIPPLAGGVRCEYCNIAPGQTYRWGPVRISLRECYLKLCERYPEMTSLRSIRNVEPGELTRFGRPLTWRITGSAGQPQEIVAERFRLVVGPNTIKSTDCNVRVDGSDLVFENGRGYGHGLGLCQWGMQGQALSNKKAAEILRYYYPGSRLNRAY